MIRANPDYQARSKNLLYDTADNSTRTQSSTNTEIGNETSVIITVATTHYYCLFVFRTYMEHGNFS